MIWVAKGDTGMSIIWKNRHRWAKKRVIVGYLLCVSIKPQSSDGDTHSGAETYKPSWSPLANDSSRESV